MPKVENLFKVLQLGTRLKQLKLQEEEKRREGEKEERFLESISDSPELTRAYYLTQGGMPWDKAIEISGHITPVQKEKKALERIKFASGFTQVRPEAVTKMGLPLRQFMRQAEISPTGFTVPIKGAPLEVSRELRQLGTEKEPTWTEQEREGDIQYLTRQGKTRQEAIDVLRQKRVYGIEKGIPLIEKAAGSLRNKWINHLIELGELQAEASLLGWEGTDESTFQNPEYLEWLGQFEATIPGVVKFERERIEQGMQGILTKEDILKQFQGAGIVRITDREGLKADYGLTDEDVDWIEGNL